MSNLDKDIKELLSVGDVRFYRTYDGGYGVDIEFYDKSYRLCHPAPIPAKAVKEMLDDWHVKSALNNKQWYEKAYQDSLKELEEQAYDLSSEPLTPAKASHTSRKDK